MRIKMNNNIRNYKLNNNSAQARNKNNSSRSNRKKKKTKAIYSILLVFFSALLIFSSYMIISILVENKENADEMEEIKNIAMNNGNENVEPTPTVTTSSDPVDKVPFDWHNDIDFNSLLDLNQDIIGWIYIPDTVIDYPIVLGKDNDYYLDRSFLKKKNRAGSIFMNYPNSENFDDFNTTLFGHNMKAGTMFHELISYQEQEFFDTHDTIYVYTPYDILEYKVASVYIAKATDDYWYATIKDKADFAKRANKKSIIESEFDITKESKILTLSTCTYEFKDARFVVHAVLNNIKEK